MKNASDSGSRPTWRLIAIAGWLVLVVTVIVQWRAITRLRGDIESLRAQPQAAVPEASSRPAAPGAGAAATMEQMQKERLEVLELVKELRQLRERASSRTGDVGGGASQRAPSSAPTAEPPNGEARQLVVAAMGGDASALDRLAELAAALRTMGTNEQALIRARSALWSAFELLGTEAGKGNAGALKAIWQASRIGNLQGLAVKALGQAAGLGNEEALRPLLDPDAYFILRSSATAALKPAADAGNERAIQALVATAADPRQQPLWLMAAQGLETAAAAGNATAIDGLATMAATTNQVIRKQAVLALEAAARKGQPQAEEWLRELGWR